MDCPIGVIIQGHTDGRRDHQNQQKQQDDLVCFHTLSFFRFLVFQNDHFEMRSTVSALIPIS